LTLNTGSTTLDLQNRVSNLESLSSTTASSTAAVLNSSPNFIQAIAAAVLDIIKAIGNLAVNSVTAVSGIFTHVETDTLCVGHTCVTETELQAMLEGAHINPATTTQPVQASTLPIRSQTQLTDPIVMTTSSSTIATSSNPISTSTPILNVIATSTDSQTASTTVPITPLTPPDAVSSSTPVVTSPDTSTSTPAIIPLPVDTAQPQTSDASASTTPNP
jgi:hypothetical protein